MENKDTYSQYLQRCKDAGCDEPIESGDFLELEILRQLLMRKSATLRNDRLAQMLVDIYNVFLLNPYDEEQYKVSRFRVNK